MPGGVDTQIDQIFRMVVVKVVTVKFNIRSRKETAKAHRKMALVLKFIIHQLRLKPGDVSIIRSHILLLVIAKNAIISGEIKAK